MLISSNLTLVDLFVIFLGFLFSEGVGIDGGNSKDWESNAKSIHLIKQRGKVKALDEEIHSEQRAYYTTRINNSHIYLFSHHVFVLMFDPFRTEGY